MTTDTARTPGELADVVSSALTRAATEQQPVQLDALTFIQIRDALAAKSEARQLLVDQLAADIRRIDGRHQLGAGAIAEALIDAGWVR